MGKGAKVAGYRYYMGLHFGLCHGPVDELLELRAGDRSAWTGPQVGSGSFLINAPALFGGDQKEGGIYGTTDFMNGEATQVANAYLTAKQGGAQTAYRGLCTLVYEGGLVGANNPYPKPWSFRLQRTTSGWYGGTAWNPTKCAITLSSGVIGMNPAHIVYEVLTNPDWGLGYPSSALDLTVFTATALALFNEGFGLCLLWNRQDTIESFLQKVMDYTAGVLVASPTTGLFQYTLIRGGYDPATLPVFTAADVLEIIEKEDGTLTNSVNEMWIKYYDPIAKQTQSVALQALGSVQSQGVVVSDSKDFTGIATADLAARICQRELMGSTVPLKKLHLKMKRSAYLLVPGGLFILNMSAAGLTSVIFRVGEIDTGTLLNGAITMTAIEDVFSMPADTYIAAQNTGWVAPNAHPVAPTVYEPYEIDFRSLYSLLGSSAALALPPLVGYSGILVGRPNSLSQNYATYTEVGGAPYVAHSTDQFSPTGVLASGVGAFDTSLTLTISSAVDLVAVALPCAAVIVDAQIEIVNVTAINLSTGVCTVARGCVDTVALPHSGAVRIFFLDSYIGSDAEQYTLAEVVNNKPCPNAPLGQLLVASAPDITVTIGGRALLPYPPALPKLNGTRFDTAGTMTGAFTLSWIERNRLTQGNVMIDQTSGTVTPEAGTTYTIRVYSSAPTLLQTISGITGTSQLLNSGASDTLSIQLESVRAGLTSFEHWVIPVTFVNASVGITDESGTQIDDETSVDIYSE
jgi:hypothetical protein